MRSFKSTQRSFEDYYFGDECFIKAELPKIKSNMMAATNFKDFIWESREYIKLCQICELDVDETILMYKKKLQCMLNKQINNDALEEIDSGEFLFFDNQQLKDIYYEELENAKQLLIKNWIAHFFDFDSKDRQLSITRKLLELWNDSKANETIRDNCSVLLCDKAFPIEKCDYKQYQICINLIRLLRMWNCDEVMAFYNKIIPQISDKVAKYRCDTVMKI